MAVNNLQKNRPSDRLYIVLFANVKESHYWLLAAPDKNSDEKGRYLFSEVKGKLMLPKNFKSQEPVTKLSEAELIYFLEEKPNAIQ